MSKNGHSETAPLVASPKPFLASVEKGKRYAWCACGRSKTQPFCDGAHKGTPFKPVLFTAEKTGDVLLCGCKQSGNGPFCDGAHNNLEDTYEEATLEEIEAMKHACLVARGNDQAGKAMLDGGAYVAAPEKEKPIEKKNINLTSLIGADDGAKHLQVSKVETQTGVSSWVFHGDSEAALFIADGEGVVVIENKSYDVAAETSLFIRPNEAVQFKTEAPITAYLTVCPQAPISFPAIGGDNFDDAYADRFSAAADAQKNAMADRFYQVLIGEEAGSKELTQFIGGIPQSRAAFHRHLYEEAIIILAGEGMMWTENHKTPVKPGDVIFLPARQGHSLECESKDGMRLMGVFFPAGSPAINY